MNLNTLSYIFYKMSLRKKRAIYYIDISKDIVDDFVDFFLCVKKMNGHLP